MKLIILLFLVLFCFSTSSQSSNRGEIEGIKKYFGFPFPLTGRRSSSGKGSNHQNDQSAEPRNGSEKSSNEKGITEELISRNEKVISEELISQNKKVISDNEKQSTDSDNYSILKIMKELNSIRKIVDQMAKDQTVKDPIVIDPMVKAPSSLFADHQESDKYQEEVSSFPTESNYELLNTLRVVLGSRKSCPENSFRCSFDTSSTSIFSIVPTSSSGSSSSSFGSSSPSSGSFKPSVSLTQTSASFVAMFPGMKIGQEAKCISPEKVCDGIKDCPNKDDESELRCRCWQEPGHYKCKGMNEKKCIPKSWLCDGVKDCSFGDDEDSSLCSQSLGQPSGQVMNGQPSGQVMKDQKMAGQNLILEYICLGPFSKYQNETNILIPLSSPRQVIPIRWLCDGEQDCEKGDDEKFCDPPYPVKVPFPVLSLNGSSFNSTSTNGSSFVDISINGTSINSNAINGSLINLLEVLNGTTMTNEPVMSGTMNGTEIIQTAIDTTTSSSPLSSSSSSSSFSSSFPENITT